MKIKVPIRKVEVFISDDGRTIERVTYLQDIETDINTEKEIIFEKNNIRYFGISPVDEYLDKAIITSSERIRFPIYDVNNLEEAFAKYIEIWQLVSSMKKN